ncbi:MAG TPA: N-acetyl-gamma-glutamyl-phosphate reductase [Alphaproteobacteria bacterium]|nr:N-acetyl-gamma-glutamyl-phosphate reductase [Alphaproteobacteria bacterium]
MALGDNRIRIGILGASGYTGAELIRILVRHPAAEIRLLSAERSAGKPVEAVFPHLSGLDLPRLIHIDDADWSALDAVFCALPHGTTQEVVSALPDHLKLVDLSADFRLRDLAAYETWYGHAHRAPALQREAVYGLTEIKRDAIRTARLCANPGCYPTAAQLPLAPLLEAGLISAEDIVIDAKSGVSGAGRAAKEGSLFAEVSEGIHAYGLASHRHAPEIEQGLGEAAARPVTVTFTPHLVPMNRGILATIYVRLANGESAAELRRVLAQRYEGEPFVQVLPLGVVPATRHVRGSNHCLIGVVADRVPGRAILVSAIDNLVKGASGQAVQNLNLMCGLSETLGLEQPALFP